MNSLVTTGCLCCQEQGLQRCGRGIVVAIAAHLATALAVLPLSCGGVFFLSWKEEFDASAKDTGAVLSLLSFLSLFCCEYLNLKLNFKIHARVVCSSEKFVF